MNMFCRFVANGLSFCGEGRIGFNYDNCKCSWKDSQSNVFWRSASKQVIRSHLPSSFPFAFVHEQNRMNRAESYINRIVVHLFHVG